MSTIIRGLSGNARPARVQQLSFHRVLARRYASTQRITTQMAQDRLAAQRRNRPVSPAMTVYKWTYESSVSALQRITGILLSGGLYGFATLYLLAPAIGFQLDSESMIAAFGALPVTIKTALKFGIAMPFTYHGFNGFKHLIWDTGRLLSKTTNGKASWAVLACSVSASLMLTFVNFESYPEEN